MRETAKDKPMANTANRKPTPAELKNRTPLGGTPIPAKIDAPNRSTPTKALLPAKPKSTAVAKPAVVDTVADYLDEVAPASIVGRMIKYSKEGKFVTPDDEEEISEDQDFIALCDETLVSWVKFNGPG